MKPFRFLMIALLSAGVLGLPGCTDTPSGGLTGKQAPDFTIQDYERTVSLHDYRGKIVLLNLWATWCPPCIEEIPDLNKLQNRMGDKISIIAVSYDDTEGAYKKFLSNHKLDFMTVHDRDKKLKELYQPTGPPESYVIDRSGRVLRKFLGPQHWGDDDFVQYLNKL